MQLSVKPVDSALTTNKNDCEIVLEMYMYVYLNFY